MYNRIANGVYYFPKMITADTVKRDAAIIKSVVRERPDPESCGKVTFN